jgi:DNA polymerase-3 subunit alpha
MINSNTINYLWLDTETTGLDAQRQDVIQLACVPVINGIRQPVSFDQYCQPIDWSTIEQEALDVHGVTVERLKTFQKAEIMVNNFVLFAKQFNTKFTIAGFNVGFDKDFIAALFKKVGREEDFLHLFTQDIRDTYKRAKKLKAQLPTTNLKLGTLATHFNIEIIAHNAISDINATMELDTILSKMLGEVEITSFEEYPLLDVDLPEPVQLHCHSMFSHTDSINTVAEWAQWCITNGVKGFSVVDHGNATSLYDITHIKTIIEKYNKDNGTKLDPNKVTGIPGVGLLVSHKGSRFYLNGWATSIQGYRNLIKVASIGWKNRFEDSDIEFPLVSLEDVISLKEGIVFGVPGVNGPVTKLLLNRQVSDARLLLEELNQCLDIRLELAATNVYRYYDSDIGFTTYNVEGGNIQKHINKFYFEIAKNLNIDCVPVSDAHFINSEDKIVQDCISRNSYKDSRHFAESRHVLKSQEMYSILKGHIGNDFAGKDFIEMVHATYEIMNKAAFIEVKHKYHLPKIDIPANIQAKTDDYNKQLYIFTRTKIKEHGRWNDSPEYVERFEREIDVVMKNATLNFLPYFLVYEDICTYARSSGFLQGIARGSAGGSLLSYYLKVIHVDPVAANLPFERFLSHARIRAGSFPDIDLDIADRARPLVMKYLQEKYNLGFAQIATFNKMKTKNAIKDAMYALYGRNRNDAEIKALCDEIDDSPQGVDEYDFLYGYIDQEDIAHKGEIELKPILASFFKKRPEVEEMVKKLIGAIRGWSRHASAFVISTLDLSADRIPTMIFSDKDLGEIMVTQYDAGMVEKSGLVKADILGIRTLSMVSDALDMIKKNHNINLLLEEKGVPFIYRLPDADKGVFSDFYRKDTDSSFQFNTELIKGYAQEFAPLNRADLAAMTALCRPGTLDAPFEDTTAAKYYMDVKNGKRTVHYLHDDLEPILKASNGVFVYQEEVMRYLVEIVGYTWEESDIIRSAIAKKKHDVIMGTFSKIRESCSKRGWTNEAIETVCQQIMAFSRYSFNKSHSWAYAELGYITLYLKHHYPLEWWCSVLNNESQEDKTRKYISYLGEKVAPPSLKYPQTQYAILNYRIVAPISAIKSVGPAAVKECTIKGPFVSLEDYVIRIDHSRVNIGAMSALIKARAADDLMDESIENYIERRTTFMNKYVSLRKSKTAFKPEMFDLDPIKVFLQEKEFNQSFNKSLLSSSDIGKILQRKWPALTPTGRRNIPYYMKSSEEDRPDAYILADIKIAENALKRGNKDAALVLLFESSNYKTGLSKSGKAWHRVSVILSDGYNLMEATLWDARKAFKWPKDTIVYVRGELKTGWKTPVSINVDEIVRVE